MVGSVLSLKQKVQISYVWNSQIGYFDKENWFFFPVVVVFTRANLYLKSKQNSIPPGIIALVAGVRPSEMSIYIDFKTAHSFA